MGYKVEIIEPFRKAAKKLIRKYPSLKDELAELGQQLSEDPTQGAALGNDCFKVRLAIKSKGRGKSGGARVITHVIHVSDETVYLLLIYDKSDRESISDQELQELLKYLD